MIYIGSVCTNSTIDYLKSVGSHIDYPGITFQRALLKGLDFYYPDLKVISAPLISSYPRTKAIRIKEEEFFRSNNNEGKSVYTGLINLPVIKMFSKFLRVRKYLKREIAVYQESEVIIYALHTPFLLATLSLKSRLNKVCVVVPDLPEFMSSSNKAFIKRQGKSLDRVLINFCLKHFEYYVLLSPYMRERLPIEGKKWVQVEGIFETPDSEIVAEKESHKTILYTGNLNYKYGIKELLDAFSQIEDSNYRLWIRGNGEALDDVKALTQKDTRVIYFDRMSKEELTKLQKRATLLINPTFSSIESTKYFFPSKTMEYLASGTPVLMCKLPCLPEEYFDHLYLIEEESVEGLKKNIISVLEKTHEELKKKGQKASEFIYSKKNSIAQAEKIKNLLKG